MNDTHGVEGKGWYGFDLDGTLAKYDGWKGIDHIGEPIEPMVNLIKKMHSEGRVVKILTARVAPRANVETRPSPYYKEFADPLLRNMGCVSGDWYREMYRRKEWTAKEFIIDWCRENLGFIPEIVYQKDHLMLELYDDRVKQVVPNEGLLIEDLYRECDYMLKWVNSDNGWLLAKLNSKFNGFLAGLWTGALAATLTFAGIEVYDKWFSQKKEPARIRIESAHKILHDLLNDWPECSQSIRTSEGEAK